MRAIFLGSKSATGVPTNITFVQPFDGPVRDNVGVFQAEFAGTATIALEGRISDSQGWAEIVKIASTDAEKAKIVALMPQMRINITAWTSGLTSAHLGV